MAINKLSTAKISKPNMASGMYGDGGGLYLQVTGRAKSWILRFAMGGKTHWMGLGSYPDVGLAEARQEAMKGRRSAKIDRINPLEAKRKKRAEELIAAAKELTFAQAAERYVAAHKAGWKNEKHIAQWASTLTTYAGPVFGDLPVQSVDTGLVMGALEPIWNTKPETASRLRGRIESVLDWATVRGHRTGDNPARWRGHLDKMLPAKSRVRAVKHHAAMPFAEVPAFLTRVRALDAVSARALEFAILTAGRTGEVIGARWDEIDFAAKVWTVPASRMKAKKDHRVPLVGRTWELIQERHPLRQGDYIFPGLKAGKPLSNMALDMTLRRLGVDATVHGFRSSFRDWAAEKSMHSPEAIEMALAHTIASKVEAAYRRGDQLDKRWPLMREWDGFCAGREAGGNVVAIGRR